MSLLRMDNRVWLNLIPDSGVDAKRTGPELGGNNRASDLRRGLGDAAKVMLIGA